MKKLVWLVSLVLWVHGAALAQRFELSASALYSKLSKPQLGSLSTTSLNDNDTRLKGQYGGVVRITFNHNGYYGHELGYMRQFIQFRTNYTTTDVNNIAYPTQYQGRATVEQAFYNFLVYFMPQGERWRPFVTGGFQAAKWGAPDISLWPGGGARGYGVNFGGGLKVKLFPHAQFRLDVREYLGGKPYQQLQFVSGTGLSSYIRTLEGSAGLGITF